MARIAGIDLPKEKRGEIGLTYIYGIGRSTAQQILTEAEIDWNIKVQDWDDDQQNRIRKAIADSLKVEGELRSEIQLNIKRLKDIGAYRISFGIESGNEQYREKVLRRKGSNDRLKKLFDMVAESGVPFSLNLIIGLPGETRELIMDTVHFTKALSGYDSVTVSIFTPYNGVVLRDVAVNNGWLDPNYISKHTTSSSALRMPPPFVSSTDIDSLMRGVPL